MYMKVNEIKNIVEEKIKSINNIEEKRFFSVNYNYLNHKNNTIMIYSDCYKNCKNKICEKNNNSDNVILDNPFNIMHKEVTLSTIIDDLANCIYKESNGLIDEITEIIGLTEEELKSKLIKS